MASRLQDVILRGTRVSQPLANTLAAGTLYFVTGENVIERSNGTTWESFSALSGGMGGNNYPLFGIEAEEAEFPYIIPGPQGPAGSGGGGGGVAIARVTLTELQLENLGVTPVTVVTAGGVDKINYPLLWTVELDTPTGYADSPIFRLRFTGISSSITDDISLAWTVSGRKALGGGDNPSSFPTFTYSANDPRNKNLEISLSANPTGAGVSTAIVNVVYSILQVT